MSSNHQPNDHITEHLVARECGACGSPIPYAGRGRPPKYCGAACRQHAWALRAAEHTLTTGADPRPDVVHETRERRIEPPAPRTPQSPREWADIVHALADQLADTSTDLHRQHWHHQQLYNALNRAVAALDDAHPGGVGQLSKRR